MSASLGVNPPTGAPTNLTAALQNNPATPGIPQIGLSWQDNASNESGFLVERSTNGGAFTLIATAPAHSGTGTTTWPDTTAVPGNTYSYRVAAVNVAGQTGYSNTATIAVPAQPAAPSGLTATNNTAPGANGNNNRVVALAWTVSNATNVTGFSIQRATNAAFTNGLSTVTVAATARTLTQTGLAKSTTYYYRVRANNGTFVSSAWVNALPFPLITN
jgi:hypothetical protein